MNHLTPSYPSPTRVSVPRALRPRRGTGGLVVWGVGGLIAASLSLVAACNSDDSFGGCAGGSSGTSGISGSSGSAGGSSPSPGPVGLTPQGDTAGSSSVPGTFPSSGCAGSSSGSSGSSGGNPAGTSGAAGTGATGGSAGMAGSGGSAGPAGSAGLPSTGGSAGAGGFGGTGGFAGSSGNGGAGGGSPPTCMATHCTSPNSVDVCNGSLGETCFDLSAQGYLTGPLCGAAVASASDCIASSEIAVPYNSFYVCLPANCTPK